MRGFTLLELLVVISIITLLTIIAVPSYNEYSRNQKLTGAAAQLQSILRQAQINAQTGTVCKIGSDTYKASSWQVILNSDKYSVSPVCSGVPEPIPPALIPTAVPQNYLLPEGVMITQVKDMAADCGVTPSPAPAVIPAITYDNLTSKVDFKLSAGCTPGINAVVEITLSLDSLSRTVRVETGGGIYVKQ